MPATLPPDWLRPNWPAPPNVRATFTTRGRSAADGASTPQGMAHFNLGDHVGDDPAAVAANRRRLHAALGARAVFLRQTHGTGALHLHPDTPDGCEADAALTHHRALACTVMVADCLPVLLASACGRAVAAAHAGWRGLAAGVLERTIDALCQQAQTPPAQVLAWLGPCIGPAAFEVGDDVPRAFMQAMPAQASAVRACFIPQPGGKHLANLPALARLRLAAAGVAQVHGNDGSGDWCTVGQPQRHYSYRRDGAASGRMAACIWLA